MISVHSSLIIILLKATALIQDLFFLSIEVFLNLPIKTEHIHFLLQDLRGKQSDECLSYFCFCFLIKLS